MTHEPRPVRIPAQLAGLLSLVEESECGADMARALAAARIILRDAIDTGRPLDRIEDHVMREGAVGAWKDLQQQIVALDTSTPGAEFSSGDYYNLYAGPAVMVGMALAYVYLTDGGTR